MEVIWLFLVRVVYRSFLRRMSVSGLKFTVQSKQHIQELCAARSYHILYKIYFYPETTYCG